MTSKLLEIIFLIALITVTNQRNIVGSDSLILENIPELPKLLPEENIRIDNNPRINDDHSYKKHRTHYNNDHHNHRARDQRFTNLWNFELLNLLLQDNTLPLSTTIQRINNDITLHENDRMYKKICGCNEESQRNEIENDEPESKQVINELQEEFGDIGKEIDNSESLQNADRNGSGDDLRCGCGGRHYLRSACDGKQDLRCGCGGKHDLRGGCVAGDNLRCGCGGGHDLRSACDRKHDLRCGCGGEHNLRCDDGSGHDLRCGGGGGHDLTSAYDGKQNLRCECGGKHNLRCECGGGHDLRSAYDLRCASESKHELRDNKNYESKEINSHNKTNSSAGEYIKGDLEYLDAAQYFVSKLENRGKKYKFNDEIDVIVIDTQDYNDIVSKFNKHCSNNHCEILQTKENVLYDVSDDAENEIESTIVDRKPMNGNESINIITKIVNEIRSKRKDKLSN